MTALPPAMWRLRAFQAAGQAAMLVQAWAASGTPGAASRTSHRYCPTYPLRNPTASTKRSLLSRSQFQNKSAHTA